MATEVARIARLLDTVEVSSTPLQKNLDQVGKILARAALVIVAAVVVVGLVRGQPLIDMLVFGEAHLGGGAALDAFECVDDHEGGLGGVDHGQQSDERSGLWGVVDHARVEGIHRLRPPARAGVGVANTSRKSFSSSLGRSRSAATVISSSARFMSTR